MARVAAHLLISVCCMLAVNANAMTCVNVNVKITALSTSSYLGRWYNMYVNNARFNGSCIVADYSAVSGYTDVIALINQGEYTSFGYANTTGFAVQSANPSEIGFFDVQQGNGASAPTTPQTYGAPNYEIMELGPVVDGLYDYSIITSPDGTLFVIARDVERFVDDYQIDVLSKLSTWGFTGVVSTPQDGCTYPATPVANGDSGTTDKLRANYQWYEILGSILYVEWGIIHIMAMVMILVSSSKNNLSETYKGLYDQYIADSNNAKEYENMAGKWPKHAGRVHMQHAINLGVAGVLACLAPALIASAAWSRFLWIFALVPWLFDVAYWICLDVPELVGIPGQLQTYIVSGGLFCFAFSVNIRFNGQGQYAPGDFEKWAMYIVPCILFALGLIQKIFGLAGCNVFRFLICGENSNTEDLSPRHQEPKEPEDGQAQTAMPSMGGGGGKGDNALTV